MTSIDPRPNPSVLVVEDHEDTSALFEVILSSRGHSCRVARTGAEALAALASAPAQVILCDLGLPDMSGIDLAPQIRALAPRAWLIALTGYTSEDDRARAAAVGFDAFLAKPAALEAVIVAVDGAQLRD